MNFTPKQQEAIEASGQNILVSAGAGSGKTTVLSERVMHYLEMGHSLSRLLILTFTRNAAHNMQVKIKTEIEKRAVNEAHFANQLKYVDGSDIVTFDSFNQKLVTKYFYKIGIKKDFSIVASSLLETELAKLIEQKFDSLYKDIESEDSKAFYALLDCYTVKDDKPIRNLISDIIHQEETMPDPLSDLNKRAQAGPNDNRLLLEQAYKVLFDKLKSRLQDFSSCFSQCEDDDEAYGKIKQTVKAYYINFDHIKSFSELISFGRGIKDLKLRRHKAESISEFMPIYEEAQKSLKKVQKEVDLYPDSKKAYELIQTQQPYLSFIYRLAYMVMNQLYSYKKANNIYEFSDIAYFALHLIQNDAEVRQELASSYDEIMVDEYQDNNDLQEEFLKLIGHGNIFMVGDVKQSIYGFRNSKPEYFMKRYKDYSQNKGGLLIDMNENFRSAPEVVKDINAIFDKIMTEDFGGADYQKSQEIISANPSLQGTEFPMTRFMEYPLNGSNHAPNINYEAKIIACDIIKRIMEKEIIGVGKGAHQASYKDFAIICDRTTKFEKIAKIFKEAHIPLKIEADQDISAQPILMTVKSLLSLYASVSINDYSSPRFLHSLLSIVRGPLGQYSEKEINELFISRNFKNDPTVKKVKKIYDQTSLMDIESIYSILIEEFAVLDSIKDFKDSSSAYLFLSSYRSIISDMAKLSYTPEEAVEYFDILKNSDSIKAAVSISPASSDSAVLTNIHKSKGLEYPIVYYIGLSSRYHRSDAEKKFSFSLRYGVVMPYLTKEFENEIKGGLISDIPSNPLALAQKELETRKDNQEKVRLLYVGLTRAQYQMNFLIGKNGTSDLSYVSVSQASSFLDLIKASGFLGTIVKYDPNTLSYPSVSGITKQNNAEKISRNYAKFVMPEIAPSKKRASKDESLEADQELLDFGTKIHQILESISLKEKDLSFIKDSKIRKAVSAFLCSDLIMRCQDYEEYHEYAFFDSDTQHFGSIDLLLVGKDDLVIIDYKLKNIEDEAYKTQLETYKKNAEARFKKPASCYLFSLLDSSARKIC